MFKILVFLLLFASCDSKNETVDREYLLEKARTGDPDLSLVMPESISVPVVDCHLYKPACRSGYKIKVKQIYFIALEYDQAEDALLCAKRIDGWVNKNWVFDQVKGEPILERFAKEYLDAHPAR